MNVLLEKRPENKGWSIKLIPVDDIETSILSTMDNGKANFILESDKDYRKQTLNIISSNDIDKS